MNRDSKALPALLFLIALICLAHVAIATTTPPFVAKAGNGGGSTNRFNLPFTNAVGALTNGALVVNIDVNHTSAQVPTNVTYGGEAMTLVNATNNVNYHTLQYLLLNPSATGSNNVSVFWSATIGIFAISASTYNGVAQTGQPESRTQRTPGSTTATAITNTTTTANCVQIDNYLKVNNTGSLVAGPGQITLFNSGIAGNLAVASSYTNCGAAGAYSSRWTNSSASTNMICTMALAPFPDSTTQPKLTTLGVQ